MEIAEKCGQNIRSVRKLRGLSAESLSELVESVCGVSMSADTIRKRERGYQAVTVEDLVYLSMALECNIQTLIDGCDPRNGIQAETRNTMGILSPDDHAILRYAATDWRGDVHALITAMGCYVTLPPKYAGNAIMALMEQVSLGISSGDINPNDLPHGIAYLEQKIGELLGGAT